MLRRLLPEHPTLIANVEVHSDAKIVPVENDQYRNATDPLPEELWIIKCVLESDHLPYLYV